LNKCFKCKRDIPEDTPLRLVCCILIQLCPACNEKYGWQIQRANGMYEYEKSKVI
jgi:hypothetical protein